MEQTIEIVKMLKVKGAIKNILNIGKLFPEWYKGSGLRNIKKKTIPPVWSFIFQKLPSFYVKLLSNTLYLLKGA